MKKEYIWTVAIKDREDPDMEIWTSSFSTEDKARQFKMQAEDKLKNTVYLKLLTYVLTVERLMTICTSVGLMTDTVRKVRHIERRCGY